MSKIQEVFNRIQETKKEQKNIKSMYRDSLVNSESYQKTVESLRELREKKKKIESDISDDFRKEFDKLDTFKADLVNDSQILSDLAINKVSRGEKIEIMDQNNTQYDPIFSVRFKKQS